MKKLFSLLLAAVLALGLTTIAWAVTEEEPGGQAGQTYTDDDRIVIEKCYRLVNDGAVSPAETFHFTLTTLGVTDSTETLDTMPRFTDADGAPITGFDISFAEGEATAAGTVKSYTLMLPEYDTVGIYSYEIAEVVDDDARTAGVTYNGQKLLLKVTVIQTEDGRVRVAAVHLGERGRRQGEAGGQHLRRRYTGRHQDRCRSYGRDEPGLPLHCDADQTGGAGHGQHHRPHRGRYGAELYAGVGQQRTVYRDI